MEAKNEMQAHIMKIVQNSKTFYQVAKAWAILFLMLGQ
jgi:small subunit ribosomal protein S16